MSEEPRIVMSYAQPMWKKALAVSSLAGVVLSVIAAYTQIDPALLDSLGWDIGILLLLIYPVVVGFHLGLLWILPRLSTRGARRIGEVLTGSFALLSVPVIAASVIVDLPNLPFVLLGYFGYWAVTRPMRAFSLSSSGLGLWPLLFFYGFAFGGLFIPLYSPLFLLAGAWVPMHRRVADLWRPATLPYLRRRKGSAFTLIELLIVVAILVITVGSTLTLSDGLHASIELQSRRRESHEWIRDELSLLRGGATSTEAGEYPPSEGMRERYPSLGHSSFEISAGPRPGLAEVRFKIRIDDARGPGSWDMVALIPARAAEGAQP